MPIEKDEFLKRERYSREHDPAKRMKMRALNFLKENETKGWSFREIYFGIKGIDAPKFSIKELVADSLHLDIEKDQLFEALIELMEEGKVYATEMEGQLYYMIAG